MRAVARVLPGDALIAPLVVARGASHELLRVAAFEVDEELLGRCSAQRCSELAAMGDAHFASAYGKIETRRLGAHPAIING